MKNKTLIYIILGSLFFSIITFSNNLKNSKKEITKLDLKYKNEKYYYIKTGKLFSGVIKVNNEKNFGNEVYKNGEKIKSTLYYKENKKPYADLNFDIKNKVIVNEIYLKNGEKRVLTAKKDAFEIKKYYANGKVKEINSSINVDIDLYELFNNENYFVSSKDEKNKNYIQTYKMYDIDGNLLISKNHNNITGVIEIEDSSGKTILKENENIYFYKSGGVEKVETLLNGRVVIEKIYSEDGALYKIVEYDKENYPTFSYKRVESESYFSSDDEINFKTYINFDNDSLAKEINNSKKAEKIKKEKINRELRPLFNDRDLEYEIIEKRYPDGKLKSIIEDYNKKISYSTHYLDTEVFNFNKIKRYNKNGNLIYLKDFYIEKDNLIIIREKYKENGKKLYRFKTKLKLKDLERVCILEERELKNSLESKFVATEYNFTKYDEEKKIKIQVISKDNDYYMEKKYINDILDYSIEQNLKKIVFTSYFNNGTIMKEEKFHKFGFPNNPIEKREFYLNGKLKKERIEEENLKVEREYFWNGNLKSEKVKNLNSNYSFMKNFYINGVLKSEEYFGKRETPDLREIYKYDNAGTLEYLEKKVLAKDGSIISSIKKIYVGGEEVRTKK